jgi:phosphate-selective porin
LLVAALVPAAALAVVSCSKSTMKGTETTSVTSTASGVVAVETFTATATVSAIDAQNRKATLTNSDGSKFTVKAGPDVANFDQLQVGDQVKVLATEEVAVTVLKNGPPPSLEASGEVTVQPTGSNPSGYAAATVEMTAQITAMDASKRKVTFQLADGSTQTYKADKSVDLSQLQVGDSVTIKVAESVAVQIVKT